MSSNEKPRSRTRSGSAILSMFRRTCCSVVWCPYAKLKIVARAAAPQLKSVRCRTRLTNFRSFQLATDRVIIGAPREMASSAIGVPWGGAVAQPVATTAVARIVSKERRLDMEFGSIFQRPGQGDHEGP